MPRNRTEKTRQIVQPGWIISRASTPYNGYDQQSLMLALPWDQGFADKCEGMWAELAHLRRVSENALEITYSHPIAVFEDNDIYEWMEEKEREEEYWDGSFFTAETPPLSNHSGTVSSYVYLLVSDMHISARVLPRHGVMHDADALIYRKDDDLFKAEPGLIFPALPLAKSDAS